MIKRTELEVLEYLNEKEVKAAQRRMKSFLKNNKLTNKDQVTATIADYSVFHENVRLGVDENGEILLGQDRLYVSNGERETLVERITKNKGTPDNIDKRMMKSIMFNELLKQKDKLDSYENGLSRGKWADIFGIYAIPDEKDFDDVLVGVIEELHNLPFNTFFKPIDVVNEFEKAIINLRKNMVDYAFKELTAEGKIKIETFKMKGVPIPRTEAETKAKQKEKLEFVVIDDEEYKKMMEVRESVLSYYGIPLNDYFTNINKKNRTPIMNEAFRVVKKRLKEDFDAVLMFESYKVEIIEEDKDELKVNPLIGDINNNFFRYFQKLTRDRHNKVKYKTCTFFWRRFYMMNTFSILEFLGEHEGYSSEKLKQQKDGYEDNLKAYMYDFKGYEFKKDVIDGSGFYFGDIEIEVKRRQDEWLSEFKGFELIEVEEQKIEDHEEIDTRQEELIARLKAEPISEIAAYVNDELGDFFDMKPVSIPMQIESVVRATNSKSNSNEKLTTVSIPYDEIKSSRKSEIKEIPWRSVQLQKAVNELSESLVSMA